MLGEKISDFTQRLPPAYKEMKGKYCYLMPLNLEKHVDPLYNCLCQESSNNIWQYLPFGPFDTHLEFKNWLNHISKEKICFAIYDSKSNNSLGIASYHDIDLTHGVIEVGAVIYSDALQKTVAATEAMFLMMNHVFQDLGYRRYQWRCHSLNQKSRNAALRLGFTFEGIFRNAHVFKGYNRDTAWYSIIDEEWSVLRDRFRRWLNADNFDINGFQINRLQNI